MKPIDATPAVLVVVAIAVLAIVVIGSIKLWWWLRERTEKERARNL